MDILEVKVFEHPEESGNRFKILRVTTPSMAHDDTAKQYGKELFAQLNKDSEADCCVDMSLVQYQCSGALGKLIEMNNRHKEKRDGRALALAGLNPDFLDVFRVTNRDRDFRIYDTPEDYRANPLRPNPPPR